ncbi:hypothetical protein FO519_002098 [Halicephalobus sp. NKZ332]|nr:hypothetical protein FO519_002098 [Halicephalobus sp. NKZ332]
MSFQTSEIISTAIRVAIACAGTYFSFRLMINLLDPNREAKKEAKKRFEEIAEILELPKDLVLDEYELRIASMIVPPTQSISYSEIGGCDNIIEQLHEMIHVPLKLRASGTSLNFKLFSPPKGILLHGTPGNGKTMIARALASNVRAKFIDLNISILTDKWYGESQKLVSALFSLARKIQPTVIFIDEIDSFLRERQIIDNETTAMMKSQFMSLWDGFNTTDQQIIIVGATNTPDHVDPAILRRMPVKFHVPRPDEAARKMILESTLADQTDGNIDYQKLAELSKGFSGADLKEVCRLAALHKLSVAFHIDSNVDQKGIRITEDDLACQISDYRKSNRNIPNEDISGVPRFNYSSPQFASPDSRWSIAKCISLAQCKKNRINTKASPNSLRQSSPPITWSDLWQIIKPYIHYLILATAGAILVAILNIKLPIMLGDLVNAIAGLLTNKSSTSFSQLNPIAGQLLLLYVGQAFFTFFYITCLSIMGERMAADLRIQLLRKLLHHDMSFFDEQRSGELSERIINDVQEWKSSFKLCVAQGLRTFAQTGGCVVSLYFISPKMTLLTCAIVPMVIMIGSLCGAFLRKLSLEAQNQSAKASGVAEEAIQNIRTVKAFAMEDVEVDLYAAEVDKSRVISEKLGAGIGVFQAGTNVFLNGIVLGILYGGAQLM